LNILPVVYSKAAIAALVALAVRKNEGRNYKILPDKQAITGDLFGIANLSWILLTKFLRVLREQ
jgi:hypothetical protein